MILQFVFAVLTVMVSSVIGVSLTSPPSGSTLSATGLHSISWTFDNTDPSTMAIQIVNPVNSTTSTATIIINEVNVTAGSITFSQPLPSGNGLIIQCTEVNNPNVILAQSGPINIASGQNPFSIQTVGGTTIVPSGQSISVFFAPAETGSFPVTTITKAVLTTSFPTVTLVVSSALVNISTERVLTTTTTEFSNLVNVTSTGSILIPISPESGNVPSPPPLPPLVQFSPLVAEQAPLVTVFPIASFKKWKRVADSSSVPLGAVTISGTRITSTQHTTSIVSPGTTISATTTKPPTAAPPATTVIPPPITVTVSPSVVTLTPTIVTVTPTNTNQTVHSPQAPVTVTQFPPGPAPAPGTTLTIAPKGNNTSVPIQTVLGTECAICTSGLINAGNKVMGEMFGWAAIWIGIIAVIVVRY